MPFFNRLASNAALALVLLAAAGCDPQRINVEEGLSTEVDVRDRFGPPDQVWDEATAAARWSTTASPQASAIA